MDDVRYVCTGGCGGEVTEVEYKKGKTACGTKNCPGYGMPLEKGIGVVTHFYNKIGVGIVKLEAPLKVGDRIHIKGNKTDFSQDVVSLQVEHKDVRTAQAGDEVGIKVEQPVREKDVVLLAA